MSNALLINSWKLDDEEDEEDVGLDIGVVSRKLFVIEGLSAGREGHCLTSAWVFFVKNVEDGG